MKVLSIFALFMFVSLGCTSTVTPPAHPIHPVAVFVADYGRHSSVFIPVQKSAYIEYSFGDWNWYAMNQSSIGDAFHALLFSDATAFGRRYLPRDVDHNVPTPFGNARMFSVCVSRADAERVRSNLETRWHSREASRIHNPYDETDFVKDDSRYAWYSDCNEATASILRDLGCKVEGATYLSHFQLSDDAAGRMDYCD